MFVSLRPEELDGNTFSLIGQDWMLLTATAPDGNFNCMTASWGGLGVLWGKPVAFCFVRPQRHTHYFSEMGDRMTACFFSPEYRKVLTYCGRTSGRDVDKVKECALTPVRAEDGGVYYGEARLVLRMKKLYADQIRPDGFIDRTLLEHYKASDFHTVYVYEILEVLKQENT